MTASPFDGSSRIVIITAASTKEPRVTQQRAELLNHAADMDERDMVVFVVSSETTVESVHGPAPKASDVEAFMRRQPSSGPRGGGDFAVLLVGKDGGVKLRSHRPVRAQELFALIDAMPMRRQEMKR